MDVCVCVNGRCRTWENIRYWWGSKFGSPDIVTACSSPSPFWLKDGGAPWGPMQRIGWPRQPALKTSVATLPPQGRCPPDSGEQIKRTPRSLYAPRAGKDDHGHGGA